MTPPLVVHHHGTSLIITKRCDLVTQNIEDILLSATNKVTFSKKKAWWAAVKLILSCIDDTVPV